MKKPLAALLISPDKKMRTKIVNEEKKITIRAGYRDYQEGPIILCCHLEPWAVFATIIKVRRCLLKNVTEAEYRADGFATQREMLAGLRKYYPKMTLNSPVTVIYWDNVQGKLVDSYRNGPLRWMRESMVAWLGKTDWQLKTLVGFMENYNLPPVGRDEEPWVWIMRGLSSIKNLEQRAEAAAELRRRIAHLLSKGYDLIVLLEKSQRPYKVLYNLLELCKTLAHPAYLAEPLSRLDELIPEMIDGFWTGHSLKASLKEAQEMNSLL